MVSPNRPGVDDQTGGQQMHVKGSMTFAADSPVVFLVIAAIDRLQYPA